LKRGEGKRDVKSSKSVGLRVDNKKRRLFYNYPAGQMSKKSQHLASGLGILASSSYNKQSGRRNRKDEPVSHFI